MKRLPITALDPGAATDGQVPTFDAAAGKVDWATPPAGGGGGGALGDLSDVDTTGATSGQVLTFDGTQWEPSTPSGGGGEGGTGPRVDDPSDPAWGTASAYDLEFETDTAALPSGWAWTNQGPSTWMQKFGAGVFFTPGGQVGDSLRILDRTLPTESTWTSYLRFDWTGQHSNYMQLGLALRNSANGRIATWGVETAIGSCNLNLWNSITSYSSTPKNGVVGAIDGLAIRRNSATSWDFLASRGCIAWSNLFAGYNIETFFGGPPTHLGFAIHRSSTAVPTNLVCHWFRVR